MNLRPGMPRTALQHTILWVAAFVIFFPLYVLVLSAFKGKTEFAASPTFAWPDSFLNFENFRFVMNKGTLLRAFGNTFYIIALSLIGNLAVSTMAAYALGRFEFKAKKLILGAYIVMSFIPFITTQVAVFTVIQSLGLFNTIYAPVVLYMGADIMQLYLYLQFIRAIPYELDENAMMEGASLFRIYWRIVLPLLSPALVTMTIIKTINIYNDMYVPYLYMPGRGLGVVSTSLMRFVADRTTEWQYISAAVLLIMLPLVVGFLLAQRHVFAGIVAGAVK